MLDVASVGRAVLQRRFGAMRGWRKAFVALTVVVGVSIPVIADNPVSVHASGPKCPAVSLAESLGKLCVESSTNGVGPTDPIYPNTIDKGDRITKFKWLVNEDSTGDPAFTAANVNKCLPARAAVDAPTAAANPALAIYANAGSGKLTDCPWPSVHASSGHSAVVASGSQADVANLARLADGKYLISVTANDYKIDGIHFEVRAGVLYSVNEEVGKPFIVRMNPLPKKTATVRIHVYNDNASTNGQWDGQTETLVTCADATPQQRIDNCNGSSDPNLVGDPSTDMSGFSVQITDVLAAVTTDVYGNPLCTQYQTDAAGKILLNGDGTPNPITFQDTDYTVHSTTFPNGQSPPNAIPADGGATGGALAGTNSTCISDHYGDIVIPNMGPNRYAATVIPPDRRSHDGDQWVQTTTLEGGHDWDTWNIEGGTGYDTELIVGGERVTPVAHGFVKLTRNDDHVNDSDYYTVPAGNFSLDNTVSPAGKNGVLTGAIKIGRAYIGSGGGTPLAGTNLSNAKEDGIIKDGLISISCLATCGAPTDTTVWTGRAKNDGTFTVNGLETGDYSVAFWDETQNYIMSILQYHVTGDVASDPANITDAGHILLPGWFTDLQGTVFNDVNGNGIQDDGEKGIPDFVLTVRTRGNSLQDQGAAVAKTDDSGHYDLSQGYPLGQFLIAEAYNPRFKNTGYNYSTDSVATNPDPTQSDPAHPDVAVVLSSQVDVNFLPIIGLAAKLNWGVQAYGTGVDYWSGGAQPLNPSENGGIVGTVTYDVTRNEFDPAYSAQEDYQPGVSGIPMQLWDTNKVNGVVQTYADGAAQQVGTTAAGATCTRREQDRGTDAVANSQTCLPLDYYVTESWQRPVGCKALGVNGQPLQDLTNPQNGELALPNAPATDGIDNGHNPDNLTSASTPAQAADCIESPINGFQIGGNGTVDGNYALTSRIQPAAFAPSNIQRITEMLTADLNRPPTSGEVNAAIYADAQNNPDVSVALVSHDYVVEAVNPVDNVAPNTDTTTDPTVGGYVGTASAPVAKAKHLYRFTDESAINVMSGDTYVPQDGYSASGDAGGPPYALTTPTSKIRIDRNSLGAGTVAKCAGASEPHKVPDNTGNTPQSDTGLGAINKDLNDAGGNPYAGQNTPVCDAKLVTVVGGRSMNPGFFIYTDVPIPSKFYGLVNDDLNVNVDRRSVLLGEVAPASNVPVGVYDENGNWKLTAHSDVNGFYEVLVPSMDTYNCPLPAGPCPNMYRLVGNDPGTLAHRNLDYNPQFRTIATEFQAWTGVVHPVDQAPTHSGITIEGPAAQFGALSLCSVASDQAATTTPELYAIDKPYFVPAEGSTANDRDHVYTLNGKGFGSGGQLTFTNGATVLTVAPTLWTDTQIKFTVPPITTNPAGGMTPGPWQLTITNGDSHLSTVNGLTFHRLSPAGSGPGSGVYLTWRDVFVVSPLVSPTDPTSAPRTTDTPAVPATFTPAQFTPYMDAWDTATDTPAGFSGKAKPIAPATSGAPVAGGRAIQRAIEAAHGRRGNQAKLIVIYPNTADNYAAHNPTAAYFENVIVHSNIKLQGVGPGGARTSTDIVNGTNIDASQFWSATQVVAPGANQDTADGSYSDDWRTFAASLPRSGVGPAELPEGEGVLAIAESPVQYGANPPSATVTFRPGVDGILLNGGDQQGNPGNVNTLPGGITDTVPGPTPPGPAQGGAIMTDQYVRNFNITNDLIESNGGTYGTIRIGTPDLPATGRAVDRTPGDNHNDGLTVAHNRILANAGTNLAGALGIFAGANNYNVSGNDFCGNFSAEYGGAISHYGQSDGGHITSNRIYYNQGYDEGGGILIGGALPQDNSAPSPGAGAVTIDSNVLISNQSNDDGGGIRFLMAGSAKELVMNNIIANNLSTHEGGGVALDDSVNVTLVNNTIVKNVTTATAATNGALSNGVKPANPAGLSTGGNSAVLQGTLAQDAPTWSQPTLINNIFADNRAGWAVLPTVLNANASAIHGIGGPGDTSPVQVWDIGAVGVPEATDTNVASPSSSNNTTNTLTSTELLSVGNVNDNSVSYVGTNITPVPGVDGSKTIGFVNPQDFLVDSLMWRNNTNASFPVIVAHMVPANLLADYHLLGASSSSVYAVNVGLDPSATNPVPTHDIDNQTRPQAVADRGADEVAVPANVNLSITKTTSTPTVDKSGTVRYTIVVHNAGPHEASGALVTDTFASPLVLSGNSQPRWTCAASAGGLCSSAAGIGNIAIPVTIAAGGDVTFQVTAATLATAPPGPFDNTATVAATSSMVDANAGSHSSTATVIVKGTGRLTVTKTASPAGTITPGTTVTYTVTVRDINPNNSVADPASGVKVADTLPAGFTPTGSWSCVAAGTSSCVNFTPSAGSLDATINLAVGTTTPATNGVVFTITGKATTVGTLSNTATLTAPATFTASANSTLSATASQNVRALAGRLQIAKTVSPSGAVGLGGQLSYTIRVTNTSNGNTTADPVSDLAITDLLPAGFVPTPSGSWSCSAGPGSACPTGALGNGNLAATFNVGVGNGAVVTFTISGNATVTGTISNTATLTPPANFVPTANSVLASTATTFNPVGNLGIQAQVNRSTISKSATAANRLVTYTVTVTNGGPDAAINAIIVGPANTPLTGVTWSCVTSASATCGSGSGFPGAGGGRAITVAASGSVIFTIQATVPSNAALGAISKQFLLTDPSGFTESPLPMPAHDATATVTVVS